MHGVRKKLYYIYELYVLRIENCQILVSVEILYYSSLLIQAIVLPYQEHGTGVPAAFFTPLLASVQRACFPWLVWSMIAHFLLTGQDTF